MDKKGILISLLQNINYSMENEVPMKRQNGTLEHDNDGLTTYSKEKCKFKVFSNETATIETTIAALSHLFNFNNFQLRIHTSHKNYQYYCHIYNRLQEDILKYI